MFIKGVGNRRIFIFIVEESSQCHVNLGMAKAILRFVYFLNLDKLILILINSLMLRIFTDSGVSFYSCHPGAVRTEIFRNYNLTNELVGFLLYKV